MSGNRSGQNGLRRNSRKTECGAKQFLISFVVRTAPFALLSNRRRQRYRLALRVPPTPLPASQPPGLSPFPLGRTN